MRISKTIAIAILAASTAHAKKFTIHHQENPGYNWTGDDKQPKGAFVELIKRACDKLKHECEFNGRTPMARSEDLMKEGKSDITLGIARSKERDAYMWFAPMVAQVDYIFFGKKGEGAKYTKMEDIKGKTVAVHIASATGRDLLRLKKEVFGGDLNILEEANSELPVKKWVGGRYPPGTLIYCTRPICAQVAKIEKADIEPVSFQGPIQSHTIAFAKKSVTEEEFKNFKAAITDLMKTDEMKTLFKDFSIGIHPEVR